MAKANSLFPREIREADLTYQQKAFLFCFPKTGFNTTKTCRILDITPSSVRRWVNLNEEFANLMCDIKDERLDLAESILLENMQHKNRFVSNAAVMFFLKTQGQKRGYVEKPSTNILITNEIKKTKEERDAIIDAVAVTADVEILGSDQLQISENATV